MTEAPPTPARTPLVDSIRQFLGAIWLFFPTLLFVIIAVFAFWATPEGKDMLIVSVEHPLQLALMYLAHAFWALVTWYSARLVSYAKESKTPDPQHNRRWKTWPRVLGTGSFAVLWLGMLLLMVPGKVHQFFQSGLGMLLLFGGVLIQYRLTNWMQNWAQRFFQTLLGWKSGRFHRFTFGSTLVIWIICLVASLLISGLWVQGGGEGGSYPLAFASVILTFAAGQYLFVFLITTRRKIIRSQSIFSPEYLERKVGPAKEKSWQEKMVERFLSIAIFPEYKGEKRYLTAFMLVSLVGIMTYFSALFSIYVSMGAGGVTVALICFSILLGIGNILSSGSIFLGFNLHVIAITSAIVLGFFLDPYAVRELEASPVEEKAFSRPDAATYFKEWVNNRRTEILAEDWDSTGYPVILAMTHGGASRSAYWTAGVLGKLEESSAGRFSHHLLALAGASGGSVGNGVFLSALKVRRQQDLDTWEAGRRYLQGDFLSFTLVRMLGLDYIRHALPLWWMDDRAAALERSMEFGHRVDQANIAREFEAPYMALWTESPAALPACFVTTTRFQDARPAYVSPVRLSDTSRLDVLGLCREKTLALSTAVVLGARFPYVSPAGNLSESPHSYFVDGGYFDNSGAGTLQDFLKEISDQGMGEEPDTIYQRLSFYLLHIRNDLPSGAPANRIHPVANDLLTPILTLVASYSQQTEFSISRLKYFLAHNPRLMPPDADPAKRYIAINLKAPEEEVQSGSGASYLKSTTSAFPMSWCLSALARMQMDQRLEDPEVDAKIQELLSLFKAPVK